jgi:putative endonuclease
LQAGPAVSGIRRFVYVLQSESTDKPYVGVTSNVRERLETHNRGGSVYTAAHRPWRLAAVIVFADEPRALRMEQYLKSGSGRAFLRRHLL